MAKYLLTTFCLNIISIIATVVVLNIFHRSGSTHHMQPWIKKLFLDFLPRVLLMKRPKKRPIFQGYQVEEYCVEEIFDTSEWRRQSQL